MGVNNDNPCPVCGSVYSNYEGDSYFRCRGCQNIYNNAIGKWQNNIEAVKITYSGTSEKPESKKPNICPCCGETSVYGEDETCENCLSRPEPEQDERIREAFEESDPYKESSSILQVTKRFEIFKTGYKSGYTSRNAEIGALKAEIESMRDFLELVGKLKDAYPEDVFPPIGKDSYFMMCKASGFSVDRVSAHVLRDFVKNYSGQAKMILEKIN